MQIELQSVIKKYLGQVALSNVTTKLSEGSIIAILGVNGAGKSTLLKCLSTQIQCTRGEILMDGEPLRRANIQQRRRLHFLPDSPYLVPHIDPVTHVGMVLDAYGIGSHEDSASKIDGTLKEKSTATNVAQLFKEFSLLGCEAKPMSSLSRGQQYKTALTAMITLDRELWLLDEPFASGMDPLGINAFKRHARHAAQRGRTVVYTTQILEIVESFADQVIVLNAGELVAAGTLDEIRGLATEAKSLQGFFEQFRPE
jgi:ABC-type multidrug transport system ATPase subunit